MSGSARRHVRRTKSRVATRTLERAGLPAWLAANGISWGKLDGQQRGVVLDRWLAEKGLDRMDLGAGVVIRRGAR